MPSRCGYGRGLSRLFKAITFDVSLRQGDTYLVVKVRLSSKFWARHLLDTVAMWLRINSTPLLGYAGLFRAA
jgi:hypothetical protein